MAVQWNVIKLPVSTEKDFTKIVEELDGYEENGWDLDHVTSVESMLILFFKKRTE